MNITLHAPQLIVICAECVGLGIHLCWHNQERLKKYHFGKGALMVLLGFGVLYWGGFFTQG